ncbi:hypothetical protein JVU11DRAFT_3887 [Chiua virens]|nr:hypothetical protein JVU11DRAFT_3887 [Chiua virens]
MDKFKELTSRINFDDPYNVQGHRAIYDHVVHLLRVRKTSPDTSSLAPCLVFYAARNILSPSFILGQIPDLLNFLSAIETFRRFAVLKSDEALEWQKFYEREQSDERTEDVRLLTTDEVCTLRCFLDIKDAQRREYILLVRRLIQLYLHYLWLAPQSCLFLKELNDIFPGSLQGIDSVKASEYLFHVDLSEDERGYFKQFRTECGKWLNTVVDWTIKRKETCRKEGLSEADMEASFVDDFLRAFPPPCNPPDMARDVQTYMNKVEDIVRTLEEWFLPSS